MGDILDTSRLQLFGSFDEQVMQLLMSIRLTRDEVDHLQSLIEDLQNTLSRPWRGCVVHPFGSIVTGLGIRSSDIDCFVSLPKWVKFNNNLVYKAKHALEEERYVFCDLFAIPKAKVPIVKFYHIPTQRNCDVNFTSFHGVQNSKLLAFLLHMDPQALHLAVIIKYWAKVHGLTGTNLMSSFALILLVIFYLQERRSLPPVRLLQQNCNPYIVDSWNTNFQTDFVFMKTLPLPVPASMCELLGGFFDYYSHFDFSTNMIAIFMGDVYPKACFGSLGSVPEDYDLYKQNIVSGVCPKLKIDTVMCVQDPFEHSRNCTVAIHERLFNKILKHIKHGAQLFHEVPSHEYLMAILTKVPYQEVIVPRPLIAPLMHVTGKVVKGKRKKNKVLKNIKNNVRILFNEYKKKDKS